jgi:NADH:ubiquinone oxidoreductase subunit 6 (subunit J)
MSEIVFYAVGTVSVLAGLGVVLSKNVVSSALFLLVALGGVAAAFVLLYAEFLALVQILVYGGAIVIVILFAIMLTRVKDFQIRGEHRQWPLAAVVSTGLLILMIASFTADADLFNSGSRSHIDVETLGTVLFSEWTIPFEAASLVLLIALIGAVVISRSAEGDRQ